MKAEVKIPKGWRRVRKDQTIHKGDYFLNTDVMIWFPANILGNFAGSMGKIYIRKRARRVVGKGGK